MNYQSNKPDIAQLGPVQWLAIGIQPQWGYLQKQAEKWIYPIPVLEAFIATKTCISNNHSAAGYVGYWTWDKDITTEYAYSWNNYPSYCFMIGKVQQQWGFEETETKTIAFPISFESIKYVFLSKIYGPASGGADTVAYNFFRKSLTGVSFDYAYTRNWLAIGGQ